MCIYVMSICLSISLTNRKHPHQWRMNEPIELRRNELEPIILLVIFFRLLLSKTSFLRVWWVSSWEDRKGRSVGRSYIYIIRTTRYSYPSIQTWKRMNKTMETMRRKKGSFSFLFYFFFDSQQKKWLFLLLLKIVVRGWIGGW